MFEQNLVDSIKRAFPEYKPKKNELVTYNLQAESYQDIKNHIADQFSLN